MKIEETLDEEIVSRFMPYLALTRNTHTYIIYIYMNLLRDHLLSILSYIFIFMLVLERVDPALFVIV